VTLIRVPPHSDFEQGSGHHHEELDIVTRGTLTMRFDEVVEIWAVSRRIEEQDAIKVDDFWKPSEQATQQSD
jgi:hypothetical protein